MSSDTPTIEQQNEVIARFMGLNPRLVQPPDPALHRVEVWYNNVSQPMKYHTSWSWLMPVVEKIETPQFDEKGKYIFRSNADVKVYYKACIIEYVPDEESGDITEEVKIQTQGKTKLEAVYKAVYQFIAWLNYQNKNQ